MSAKFFGWRAWLPTLIAVTLASTSVVPIAFADSPHTVAQRVSPTPAATPDTPTPTPPIVAPTAAVPDTSTPTPPIVAPTAGVPDTATPTATPTTTTTPTPTPPTIIKMPDGSVCQFAGTGATAAFNGQRLNYFCGPASNNGMNVLLGNPTFQNGNLTVTQGIVDNPSGGPTLRSSQQVTMTLTEVDLVDSTICVPAAPPDNVIVGGQTLNYTCGRSNEGILGGFDTTNPLWMVTKVVLQPQTTTVQRRETWGVSLVIGAQATPVATSITLPDGTVCQFAGTGATLAFNGQRVNYSCGTAPDGSMVVILGTPTFKLGVGDIQQGRVVAATGGGFTLASTQTITMLIGNLTLVDGTTCAFAGTGATLVINQQRMNYTCGQPSVGLIGDFDTSNPLWTATRVATGGTASNPTVLSQATVGIQFVIGAPPPAGPAPAPTPTPAPVQPAPPQARDGRYFNETNFRIANDAFWNFFQSRGGTNTFGFPVSRQFGFLGCQVQIFQRAIMQQCGDNAAVALLNLLDPELFPYTHVNGSVFPGPDDGIKGRTPVVGSPNYDQAIIQFVMDVAPDTFQGQPVQFQQTFNDTGGLEIWGAPISNPAFDPSNSSFIYQRFQRGIMHFAAGQGTRGILLADFLKSILLGPDQASQKGANLPPDLDAQAKGSGKYAQYCPGQERWLCRPADLPGSDLMFAFEAG